MGDLPWWVPGVIAALVVSILEWRRRSKTQPTVQISAPVSEVSAVEIKSEPDKPIGFGRKNKWVAVQATDPALLSEALQLTAVEPCNWHSGFLAAYAYPSDQVFVTPPLDRWVLAVGAGLPDPSDPQALTRWRSMMSTLSEIFGVAQYFATHRASSYTAWARYSAGVEERLFAHADDPIHDIGQPLPEESEILARLPDPTADEADPDYWRRNDIRTPEEEDVLHLAAAWSFDPTTLDSMDRGPSVGLVGRMANQRA